MWVSRHPVASLTWGCAIALWTLTPASAQGTETMSLQVGLSKVLSQSGSTRATRYAVTNKILTRENRTHVAWLDSISETMIATYDHTSAGWTEPVRVGTGKDNHGGPALVADSNGHLHVIFGPHGGPFQHAVSTHRNQSREWIRQENFGVEKTGSGLDN